MSHLRTASVVALAVLALPACSTGQHTDAASFDYHGTHLAVTNDNTNMPVSFVRGGPAVDVSVTTTTAGKKATVPHWRLDGDSLELGTPCGEGWVGYCEGSYRVSVPAGVEVTLNGRAVAVR